MAYLDANTFEVVDNIIEIDDRMVPIIRELNNKGYKTTYCCSGHEDIIKVNYVPYYLSLNERLATDNCITLGKYEDYKIVTTFVDDIDIYVSFAEDYEFDYIPEGFVANKTIKHNGNECKKAVFINKRFSIYKDKANMILESEENLARVIDESNQKLLEWARSLPSRKDVMKLKKVNE